jgi:hypothetical protein
MPPPAENDSNRRQPKAPTGSPEAARKLRAASKPITGTIAQRYLAGRSLINLVGCEALGFHPHCYYRSSKDVCPTFVPHGQR